MKNIHLIPTDKLSNGYILGRCIKELSDVKIGQFVKTHYLMFSEEYFQPYNIHITSDEEVKEGDYCVDGDDIYGPFEEGDIATVKFVKIILTTDEQLIRYGVQAIDNEFLEWFVKNPMCKEVEIFHQDVYSMNKWNRRYSTITSKEEPKTNLEKLQFPELVKEFAEYYKDIQLVEVPDGHEIDKVTFKPIGKSLPKTWGEVIGEGGY